MTAPTPPRKLPTITSVDIIELRTDARLVVLALIIGAVVATATLYAILPKSDAE